MTEKNESWVGENFILFVKTETVLLLERILNATEMAASLKALFKTCQELR